VRGNSTFGRKVHDGKRDPTPQESGPDKCWEGGDFGQDHRIGPGADPKEIGKVVESIERTRHRQKINNVMSASKKGVKSADDLWREIAQSAWLDEQPVGLSQLSPS